MNRDDPFRPQGGSITSAEAFVLGVMAAVIVAIGIPSYLAVRDRSDDSTARATVSQAAAAVEEHLAARRSLAGVAPSVLRRYDSELDPAAFRLDVSGNVSYCVESSTGGRAWHLSGPGGSVTRGSCP